jgi:hypothetical protein
VQRRSQSANRFDRVCLQSEVGDPAITRQRCRLTGLGEHEPQAPRLVMGRGRPPIDGRALSGHVDYLHPCPDGNNVEAVFPGGGPKA